MSEPIVTHADLEALRNLRAALYSEPEDCRHMFEETPEMTVIDRLIAAAEADAPPLPEGWVIYTYPDGSQSVLWHHDGVLFRTNDLSGWFGDVGQYPRSHLTPLRPTITEADVERAAHAIFRERGGLRFEGCTRDSFISEARAAFKAAGIEVQP